ncbi:DUF3631 domain-containing protein [Mycolicibacterium pulveris]|nr:DUF3631 domain-containing protein [Mycolicibacterium pulveris]
MTGCATLDQVSAFLGRFIAYPTDYARVAHVLWIAHTYRMDAWDSTPRLAFMSTEKGSGKTRALEVTYHLVSAGHHASNVSNAFILGAIADNPSTTILLDEIDTVYGPRAKGNEDLRSTINSGHRRGGEAGRGSWVDGTIKATRFSSYCPVALAGLGTLPETVADRAVVIRMKRRKPTDHVEPWRERLNADEARELAKKLETWVTKAQFDYPDNMPVTDRKADVWEALVMVADAAGGHWPTTARQAAVAMTSGDDSMSAGVRLLRDLREVFGDKREMFTADILEALRDLPESPWRDLTDRKLAKALGDYDVKSRQIRRGKRGYHACDLSDPWERHLPPHPQTSATSATSATPQVSPGENRSASDSSSAWISRGEQLAHSGRYPARDHAASF